MYVGQGDVLTFSNGMVGTVTGSGKVALVGKNGCPVSHKSHPLLTDYNAKHRIVRIETREAQNKPLELVWEDEVYCFQLGKFYADLTSAETQQISDELSALIDKYPQYHNEGLAA